MALLITYLVSNGQRNKADTLATRVKSGSQITHEDSQVEVTDGNCTVFEIQTSNQGDPRIDARVDTGIIFEIPSSFSEYEITDWKEHKAFLEISNCRCIDRGYNPITSGSIKVKKLENGQWEITADVGAIGKDSGEERTFQYKGVIPVSSIN